MRIKTKGALVDFLDEKSQKRKRELITLSQLLNNKRRKHELEIIRRTSVVLAYAHWEGFVKESSIKYVEYVTSQALSMCKLSKNFRALAYRPLILDAAKSTKKMYAHFDVVDKISNNSLDCTKIVAERVIDTESNLKEEVFKNICFTIGINYSRWETWGPFISDLVEDRCVISHGELMAPTTERSQEVITFVIDAIDWFKTDIENALISDSYIAS